MSSVRTITDVSEGALGWSIAYWSCQILGWGSYVALGLSMVLRQTGPQPVIIGGYGLFFFYSIALTHLLRREARRREWLELPPGRAAVRPGVGRGRRPARADRPARPPCRPRAVPAVRLRAGPAADGGAAVRATFRP